MFDRIMVVYDRSRSASQAFDRALKLGAPGNSEIGIAAVIRSVEFALDVGAQDALECSSAILDQQMSHWARRARFAGSAATVFVRTGHPGTQIALAAKEWRADLIVTGHSVSVWTFPWLWLSSSVSRQLLVLAPCPVLVVP